MKRVAKKILQKDDISSIIHLMKHYNIQDEFEVFDKKLFLKDYGFRDEIKVVFCDHHLAHALPTLFYNPEWNEALLYTADGGGDGLSFSFMHFTDNKLNTIYGGNNILGETMPDALGKMYGITTEICGFKRNRHEGKITGLAAYGEPKKANTIIDLYLVENNGRIIPKFKTYADLRVVLQDIYNEYGREVLSASTQVALEQLILQSISTLQKEYKFSNIGLSGGVHANVKLNDRISKLPKINDVFVFPPMTDEGLVVGYILDYLLQRDGLDKWLKERKYLNNMYWGEKFEIDINDIPDEIKIYESEEIVTKSVELLKDNKICALFSESMEYGPRALGARSILINPSDKSINDTVNKRLDRTEFMPFAPYVLEEMVEDVFEVTKSNKKAMQFMTITTNVKNEWKELIQATVHVDGTARPQTINRTQNKIYYDILKLFYDTTGIPCLVNTSFNAHEEPIINTHEEAFNALLNNRIDYLILENMILCKK